MSQTLNETPVVITVLGARSGTSALSGTLGLLGCTLPNKMMAANHGNTKGYFEPQDLADEHDAILASVSSSWDDSRPFPQDWFTSDAARSAQAAIIEVYRRNYPISQLAVLKEPRMCRIMPLWFGIFEALAVRPVFCFIDRNPLEVAKSLENVMDQRSNKDFNTISAIILMLNETQDGGSVHLFPTIPCCRIGALPSSRLATRWASSFYPTRISRPR